MDKNTKIYVNPTGPLRDRRTARRRRRHRPQDHRGHLRRRGARTAAARSRAKIRRRSIGPPATWRATSRRTSSRRASRTARWCSWPTRSAWPIRSPCSSTPTAPGKIADDEDRRPRPRALQAHAARHHRVAATCAGRSTGRPRPSDTSAAREPEFTWERTDKAAALAQTRRSGRSRQPEGVPAGTPRAVRRVQQAISSQRRPSWPPLRFTSASRCRRRAVRLTAGMPPHGRARRVSRPLDRDPTARARSTRSPQPRARAGLHVHHPHRPRRRHARARSAGVPARRALSSTPSRSARSAATSSRSNLRAASPYPLAGETARRHRGHPSARRLGGRRASGFAEPALRWTAGNAPYDGIEWLNVDSEWRDDGRGDLLGTPRCDRSSGRPKRSHRFRPAGADAACAGIRPSSRDRSWRSPRWTRTPTG